MPPNAEYVKPSFNSYKLDHLNVGYKSGVDFLMVMMLFTTSLDTVLPIKLETLKR